MHIYKQDLALNNNQGLICHLTKWPNLRYNLVKKGNLCFIFSLKNSYICISMKCVKKRTKFTSCIRLFHVNVLSEGINSFLLPSNTGKIVAQTGLSGLVRATSLRAGKILNSKLFVRICLPFFCW